MQENKPKASRVMAKRADYPQPIMNGSNQSRIAGVPANSSMRRGYAAESEPEEARITLSWASRWMLTQDSMVKKVSRISVRPL